jgi:hypothetical protein
LHAHEQENCQYVSNFEQEDNEYISDLEQQQGCKYISDLEPDSSVFADFSMDRYACQAYDQFSNHVEHTVTDDCIDNYMFLADHNQYALNPTLSLSCDHYSEEGVVATDDQDLIIRELEGYQFSRKEAFMDEQLFSVDQYVSDLGFKDLVAALYGVIYFRFH